MYDKGIGTNEIANKLHLHRSTIQKWLKKSSIKLRKRTPSHHYNIHFFSTYTQESCYWAGFIMADGCIRKTCLHIKLANKDRNHLQKFLDCIGADYQIKGTTSYSTIDISGQWFLNDLKTKFGIVPRKTFTTTFPNIPKKYHKDFIRGIMDGDGCITHTTCPTLSFCGTEELLTSMLHIFKSLGIRLKSGNDIPPIQTTNKNIGQVYYSGRNAKHILDWLYKGTTDKNRLTRKYNRYVDLFCRQVRLV